MAVLDGHKLRRGLFGRQEMDDALVWEAADRQSTSRAADERRGEDEEARMGRLHCRANLGRDRHEQDRGDRVADERGNDQRHGRKDGQHGPDVQALDEPFDAIVDIGEQPGR